MPKSIQGAKSNYFEGNIRTHYFWCTQGCAWGTQRDRSVLAVWKSLWCHLHQLPPPREQPSREKHSTGSPQHPGTPSTFKHFIRTETTILPPSNGRLMQRYLRRYHFLPNHTLTQTTTASAFQLGQFSHHSWESLKASCVFGKVQFCRHGSIKNSTEHRSLFKAELFAFVYL